MSTHSHLSAGTHLVLSLLLATAATASQVPCRDGDVMIAGDTVRGVRWTPEPSCFTLEVPGPGRLWIDAGTARGDRYLEVRGCSPEDEAALHPRRSWRAGRLAELGRSARLEVCVGDLASQAGETFKLGTFFLPEAWTKGGDPGEDEPEPEGLRAVPADRDPLAPPKLPASLCRQTSTDDHADIPACATELRDWGKGARTPGFRGLEIQGLEIRGEIANPWGDDEDVFLLSVHRRVALSLEEAGTSASAPELHLGLFDALGHRLTLFASKDDEGSRRLAAPLSPGRYFLRVASPQGDRPYRLRVRQRPLAE